MWNALGTLIEDEGIINDTSSDFMIQYVTPKEYIWVRRRDLFGAELRIGYVESPPYIQVVYNNSEIVYGNKVVLGNTVILNEDRVKTQIMHLLDLFETKTILYSVFYFKTYTGLLAQLFNIIASEINCTYLIKPSMDGLFGAKNTDGSWSGVVGELQRKELDFSLADLSVTSERSKVNHQQLKNYDKNFYDTDHNYIKLILGGRFY